MGSVMMAILVLDWWLAQKRAVILSLIIGPFRVMHRRDQLEE